MTAEQATISKHFTFDSAHRLMNHDGKCRRLHGHTYGLDIAIEGPIKQGSGDSVPDRGMVLDFSELSRTVKNILSGYDHFTILERGDPLADALPSIHVHHVDFAPTAENLAGHFARAVRNGLDLGPAYTIIVTVAETPTSTATATA